MSQFTRRSCRQSGELRSETRWATVGTTRYMQMTNPTSFQMKMTKVPVGGNTVAITAAMAVHRPGMPSRRNANTV